MFCPPDYLNWIEMRQQAREWASRVYLADALEVLEENPQEALDENKNVNVAIQALAEHRHARARLNLKSSHFDIELITFWIMNKLDDEFSAVLCSPSGSLLRSNHPIHFHPDQFFYFSLRFPLREMSELRRIYDEYDAKRMTSKDLWDRFTCIDAETGLVKEKIQTKRQFNNYFGGFPYFETDNGAFETYVKPFLGWYVVFDSEYYFDDMVDNIAALGLENKHWATPSTEVAERKSPKKRGPQPAPAKREFEQRYPNGLPEGLSADAVAAELTEAGFPITGRSILNYDSKRKVQK